ncbi:restriction endonuclease subunit S [Limosilactobacillus reuteri]|uniref:restriction endonuclease subunit S n=1 Tax=Limosilactobacillus reuteri TaxID=1598 RepID=UPI000A3295DF|nr:restriction endonuclease subunit S [Limosilactobacillus reuteri]
MKNSEITWIGEIPENWDIVPIYKLFSERKNKNSNGIEKNLLSLSYGKIKRRNIYAKGGLLPESFNTYNIVEPGDIIIRPTDLQNDQHSLRTGLVKEHGIITSAYICLAPISNTNSNYYQYLLHSYDIVKVFYNMGNGVRQGLNYREFSHLKVLLPSQKEQKRIADFLDKKCTEIDKLSQQITDEIEDLKAYENSLITKAVTKGLNTNVPMKASGIEWIGKIPENWNFEKLKYLSSCNDETLDDSTRKDYEFDYVDISSVTFGKGISKYEKMTFETSPSRARRIVKDGDVIISTVRTYLKAIAYIQKHDLPIVVSTGFAVLRPNSKVNKRFFMYATQANTFISRIEADSYGVSYPAINADKLVNCGIIVPPKKEQAEVAKYLDEKCAEINKLILQKTRQSKLIREYKNSLIYDYVTGKKQVPTN